MYGAFQGYARAFYSELIPHGEEARWYALFSITDKVCIYIWHYLRLSLTFTVVKFFRWTSRCGSHRGYHRQYSLRVLLPSVHGVAVRPRVNGY